MAPWAMVFGGICSMTIIRPAPQIGQTRVGVTEDRLSGVAMKSSWFDSVIEVPLNRGGKRGHHCIGGWEKGSSLNSAFLTLKLPASSVYVHVLEAPSPLKRLILVTPPFPSSKDGGLPLPSARSASTLVVSRPAQRSLALRPVGSLHRQSDTSVSKASAVSLHPHTAPIASGWSDPLAGGNGYLWRSKTFHGNTPSPISVTRYNRPKSSDFLAANSS